MTSAGRAGPQERTTTTPWLSPEEFTATLPKAGGFGAVFFTDEDDRPVQLPATHTSAHPRQWPGGVADPGERPWQTAVRACREETGLVVPGPPRLLAAVFGLPGKEWPLSTRPGTNTTRSTPSPCRSGGT
ncbi:NUDIX domain-containing protein [Streptomyces sp. NPDC058646]|uniref:NUDIX domain-containing protein n=1 Tax=Streptomyces sp. NPDC058646 TaxID=3346574 RepID=UPI003656258D